MYTKKYFDLILFFNQIGKDMLRNVLHKFWGYGGLALGMSGVVSAGYVTKHYCICKL